jgi:hypothetical protein
MKDKGKPIGERNGIKIYKTLKPKKQMNRISQKQKIKNKNWKQITDEKCIELNFTCEWCGQKGTRDFSDFNRLEGHHKLPRRYGDNTKKNCFITHRQSCHKIITDNSINVLEIPDKNMWLLSKKDHEKLILDNTTTINKLEWEKRNEKNMGLD